jgi:hypothetical protein
MREFIGDDAAQPREEKTMGEARRQEEKMMMKVIGHNNKQPPEADSCGGWPLDADSCGGWPPPRLVDYANADGLISEEAYAEFCAEWRDWCDYSDGTHIDPRRRGEG